MWGGFENGDHAAVEAVGLIALGDTPVDSAVVTVEGCAGVEPFHVFFEMGDV